MEHEMKISSSIVRRLRTERGWSQDQLAIASGLSLRTIQRVEAEGIASMDTAVSLAATYEIRLIELQEDQHAPTGQKPSFGHSALFLGTAGEPGMTHGFELTVQPSDGAGNIYLEVAAGVTMFVLAGRYFEQRSMRRAGAALRALL